MYTEFDENAVIEDGEYLCVCENYGRYYYCVYTYINNQGELSDYSFKGKGFYYYDDEWEEYTFINVIAYKPIEEYIPRKEITNK